MVDCRKLLVTGGISAVLIDHRVSGSSDPSSVVPVEFPPSAFSVGLGAGRPLVWTTSLRRPFAFLGARAGHCCWRRCKFPSSTGWRRSRFSQVRFRQGPDQLDGEHLLIGSRLATGTAVFGIASANIDTETRNSALRPGRNGQESSSAKPGQEYLHLRPAGRWPLYKGLLVVCRARLARC